MKEKKEKVGKEGGGRKGGRGCITPEMHHPLSLWVLWFNEGKLIAGDKA